MVGRDGTLSFPLCNTVIDYCGFRGRQRIPVKNVENRITKAGGLYGVKHYRLPFSSGTSKWNKIEHRLFSFITQNRRGKPLYDLVTIVNLISNTTTNKGLIIKSAVDTKAYDTGIEASDYELAKVRLKPHAFHGEWNYTIKKGAKL